MNTRSSAIRFLQSTPKFTLAVGLAIALSGCTRWVALAGVSSSGVQGNGNHHVTSISADGRYLVFNSESSNLVPSDFNGALDVFVRDFSTGVTSRVSVGPEGLEANGHSHSGSISGDGRFVAFVSSATNLVAGDTNNETDIFLHDRDSGLTQRVSQTFFGGVQANGPSSDPDISSDGNFIAFVSKATNLVDGSNPGASGERVFLGVREGTLKMISVDSDGSQGHPEEPSNQPSISANGNYVAYFSSALGTINTGRIYRAFSGGGDNRLITSAWGPGHSPPRAPEISEDGEHVFYIEERNRPGLEDMANPAPRDRIMIWPTYGLWPLDFPLPRPTEALALTVRDYDIPPLSEALDSRISSVSMRSPHCFSFSTTSNRIVASDNNSWSDVFVHGGGQNSVNLHGAGQASVNEIGILGNARSYGPVISKDCGYVGFTSTANNLAPDITALNIEAVIKTITQVTVTEISPRTLPRGTTTRVQLFGRNLGDPSRLAFNAEFVTFSNVSSVHSNQVWADATVDNGATSGPQTIRVKLLGAGAGPDTGSTWRCLNCISYFY